MARGRAILPYACCHHCQHTKPHLGLPVRRDGQPVLSCSWERWFLLNKCVFMGCLAAGAKCVTQKITWITLLLAREKRKGEEIHKAIIHVLLSGRLCLSSLFNIFCPPLIAAALLDSGFSPGATVKSYCLVDVNGIVSGGTFPHTVVWFQVMQWDTNAFSLLLCASIKAILYLPS